MLLVVGYSKDVALAPGTDAINSVASAHGWRCRLCARPLYQSRRVFVSRNANLITTTVSRGDVIAEVWVAESVGAHVHITKVGNAEFRSTTAGDGRNFWGRNFTPSPLPPDHAGFPSRTEKLRTV